MSKLKSWIMPKLHGSGEIGNLWTPGRSADRGTHAGKPPETVSEVCLRVMSQQPHSCTGRPVNSSSRSIREYVRACSRQIVVEAGGGGNLDVNE